MLVKQTITKFICLMIYRLYEICQMLLNLILTRVISSKTILSIIAEYYRVQCYSKIKDCASKPKLEQR